MPRIELNLMGSRLVLDDRQCGLRPDIKLVLLSKRPEGWRCSAHRPDDGKVCAHAHADGCHLNSVEG